MVTVNYKGQEVSLAKLCKELGLKNDVVRKRIRRGWALEDAMNMALTRRPDSKDTAETSKPVEYINSGTGLPCD